MILMGSIVLVSGLLGWVFTPQICTFLGFYAAVGGALVVLGLLRRGEGRAASAVYEE